MSQAHLAYVLRLADNALILGQRNAEWCSHGPALEEDIALANISLDLIGQARLLYTHAATLDAALNGTQKTEDDYAYFRTEREFANYTLSELPHFGPLAGTSRTQRDYAVTIVRNFLYSALMAEVWTALQTSTDTQLAAIAAKSIKERRYHLHHARDWLVRFGDGTEESHRRAQAALDYLMPYTREFFAVDSIERDVAEAGIAPLASDVECAWCEHVASALEEAPISAPAEVKHVTTGKQGKHSEHMGYLLAECKTLHVNIQAQLVKNMNTIERAWSLLEAVPDPEIPVVSIRELGILRDVRHGDDGVLEVITTPTYSGCPAMSQIVKDIAQAIDGAALGAHRIETVLAPAWTTDWITDEAREKLRRYGIASPSGACSSEKPLRFSPYKKESMMCRRCGSTHTETLAQFGSTACKALYRCIDCREPFDYFKPY